MAREGAALFHVSAQNFFAIPALSRNTLLIVVSKRRSHSRCQRHELVPMADQLKRERVARNVSGKQAICFEQFRNHGPKPLRQLFDRRSLGGQSGHVVAGGNPNVRFRVPVCVNVIDARLHRGRKDNRNATAVIQRESVSRVILPP